LEVGIFDSEGVAGAERGVDLVTVFFEEGLQVGVHSFSSGSPKAAIERSAFWLEKAAEALVWQLK